MFIGGWKKTSCITLTPKQSFFPQDEAKNQIDKWGVSELLQSMQNYIPNPTHMQIVFTHNEVNKFNMQGKWIGMNCL
jgi:hypothetical protein